MRFTLVTRTRRCLLGFGLLAMLCATIGVNAQTLTVGVENTTYLPQYGVENGQYTGFARALLDEFAAAEGVTLVYKPLPVKRLFTEFLDGGVDLKYPDNPMWAAEEKAGKAITYSDPVVAYIDGVSVLPSRFGKGVEGIKTLGTVRGFTAWEWLDSVKAGKVVVAENDSFDGLVRQALVGRVDGAYANIAVVQRQLNTTLVQPGGLVFDPGLPHTRSYYHLSSLKHGAVIGRFNSWMSTHKGAIAALKARFQVEAGVR